VPQDSWEGGLFLESILVSEFASGILKENHETLRATGVYISLFFKTATKIYF
jgi:hypothetical protein